MKTAWALALLIVTGSAFAVPQRERAMSARTAQRPSLGEAMERVYAGEIESVIADPPASIEEIQQAALSWRFRYDDAPSKRGAKRSRPLDSGPLTITIDRHTANESRATAIVTKKYDGTLYRRWNKPSRVRSTATFRHTWMNDGSRWLLMTIEPLKASMTVDGKAFTPDKKHWNPNSSFRAPTPFDPSGREPGLP